MTPQDIPIRPHLSAISNLPKSKMKSDSGRRANNQAEVSFSHQVVDKIAISYVFTKPHHARARKRTAFGAPRKTGGWDIGTHDTFLNHSFRPSESLADG